MAEEKKKEEKKEEKKDNKQLSTAGKIWNFLTTTTGWFQTNLYATVHGDKDFKLENINFLPRYVQDHIKNDFYTKMFAQLYPDPEVSKTEPKEQSTMDKIVDGFSNAVGSAVNRVTNAVANQITATGNYARNLVSTLTFGLVGGQKAAASGENMSMKVLCTHIPHLRVVELRLNDKLTQKGILLDCLKKLFNSAKEVAIGDAGWNEIKNKLTNALDKGLEAVLKATLNMSLETWMSKMTSGSVEDAVSTRIGGLAYSFIRNSASGTYMNTYELPCSASDKVFLKSVGTGGFEKESTSNAALGMVNDFLNGNLTINENVSWKAGQFSGGPFQGSLVLFNDTLEMYANNLNLVLRLVTHSMPIRDSFLYRPPCIYDVTEVGARRCYFCSGDFTVKKLGKVRRLKWEEDTCSGSHDEIADKLLTKIKKILSDVPEVQKAINDDIVNYVPDAFEVQYTFSPLISENYNTFVYYFLEGADRNPVEALLPVYTDNDGNKSRSTISTKYGQPANRLGDKLMVDFTDAFVKNL